jgi:hypothetical protein
MAGRIKHMERSHRSVSNNSATFYSFIRKATIKKDARGLKLSFADKVKKLFRKTQARKETK